METIVIRMALAFSSINVCFGEKSKTTFKFSREDDFCCRIYTQTKSKVRIMVDKHFSDKQVYFRCANTKTGWPPPTYALPAATVACILWQIRKQALQAEVPEFRKFWVFTIKHHKGALKWDLCSRAGRRNNQNGKTGMVWRNS